MAATPTILNNVSNFAVWGSLSAALLLSAFMFVQALLVDKDRVRYLLFATLAAAIAAVDFLKPQLGSLTYEHVRIVLWAVHPASLLWLFHVRSNIALAVGGALFLGGELIWVLGYPELASTLVVPSAFYVAAVAHGRIYLQKQGYASCVLATFSMLIGLMCSLYYIVVSRGDPTIIGLGYLHYAVTSLFALLLGWIHLPRELRGKAPVRLSYRHGGLFFAAMVVQELALQLSLLFGTWPPIGYMVFSLTEAATAAILFFYNRHQLVIYTDNVSQLLEERTISLKQAREELERQYDIQAIRLEEQARELEEKASVIERQRRLELAAQTAGQAAHDIQNLISPVLTWLRDLKQHTGDPDYIALRVRDLEAQVGHLLEVNSQLLCLARRGRLERTPLCTRELVERLAVLFPNRRLHCSSDGSPWILGSFGQLLRALSNLATNAFDAAGELSPVTVQTGSKSITEVQRCHLGFLQPGRYAYIEVADRGPGVPADILEQIFEPFFSSKRAGERSGSGLGLSIVTAVVDDLGGVLDLQTGKQGTTFTLYFPLIDSPATSQAARQLSRSETVLVIDDDSIVREECERVLEQAGYTAFTAASGAEALKFLQSCPVDVVILDFSMPGMNGYETSFGILNVTPGTPFIVHSSFLRDEDRRKLSELGTSAILLKPCPPSELLAAVDNAVGSAQAKQANY